MKKFILVIFLMVISRFYDAYTTFIFIPDLERETNFLVSMFGIGWTSILIVQIVVMCFLSYTAYIYYFKTIKIIDFDENISLKQFISIFHFNNPNDFFKMFYKLPTNKHSFLYSLGAIVPKGLIIISLIAGTSTTMLILNDVYRTFYREYNVPIFLYASMAIILAVLSINFYRKEKQERIKISKQVLA